MSNAPRYQGTGQPALSQGTGLLGRLSSFFGQGGVPAYRGTGQPVHGASGPLASAAPVYRQAPAMQPMECTREEETTRPDGMSTVQAALVYSDECDPFARGPIAIIVPRQG